jgi:hypothetical protein
MATETKNITSVKAFVEAISTLRKERLADNAQQWFFRGQKNSSWEVRPSIFRGDDLVSEHIFIDRARRQNPIEFRDCTSDFEILTKLQHYGLGTRLLDVTLNPLVALYFATEDSSEYVENKNGQFSYKEHDGVVHYRFASGCSLRDIQIRVALAIPFVEFGKSMSLERFCERMRDDVTITHSEYEQLIADDFEFAANLIQRNSFIVAANSNPRLIQQRGAFLIAPSININTGENTGTSILSKAKSNLENEFDGRYLIPKECKNAIREELDFFNVNEATLFPEFEHQMRYIQGQIYPNVGTIEEYKQFVRMELREPIVFDRETPDVSNILEKTLPKISQDIFEQVKSDIENGVSTLDWRQKDSVLSGLRRSIKKGISTVFTPTEAEAKANEIVNELLG